MTMDNLKFDGDSHESSAHWFGMTGFSGRQLLIGIVSVLIKADNLIVNLFLPTFYHTRFQRKTPTGVNIP